MRITENTTISIALSLAIVGTAWAAGTWKSEKDSIDIQHNLRFEAAERREEKLVDRLDRIVERLTEISESIARKSDKK